MRDRGAPTAVVVELAAAVGDASILASWAGWEFGGPTTWTCWAVTSTTLVNVRVVYDRARYDRSVERDTPLVPSSQSAWVRPIAEVIGLEYGTFYKDDRQKDTYYPLGPIKLAFAQDHTVIPHQSGFSAEDRDTPEAFIKAIREGAGFEANRNFPDPSQNPIR